MTTAPALTRASPNYPALIQQQLGLNYAPPCTICHRDDNGGSGTVVQPFGRALMSFGLVAENPASLTAALEAAAAENLDSGGDGLPDIDELEADMNPNAGGNGRPTPGYGCALLAGADASERGGAAIVLLMAALSLVIRARQRKDPATAGGTPPSVPRS